MTRYKVNSPVVKEFIGICLGVGLYLMFVVAIGASGFKFSTIFVSVSLFDYVLF